jgi:hypothetical protein
MGRCLRKYRTLEPLVSKNEITALLGRYTHVRRMCPRHDARGDFSDNYA